MCFIMISEFRIKKYYSLKPSESISFTFALQNLSIQLVVVGVFTLCFYEILSYCNCNPSTYFLILRHMGCPELGVVEFLLGYLNYYLTLNFSISYSLYPSEPLEEIYKHSLVMHACIRKVQLQCSSF